MPTGIITYWYASSNGNDNQTHGVGIDADDTASSTDKGDHGETDHSNPQYRGDEAYEVPFPIISRKYIHDVIDRHKKSIDRPKNSYINKAFG